MDTRELMIGDKVLVKVLSQIPNTYSVHTWTAEDYLRDLLQVKPIELTAEILEENGLKYEVDYGGYHRSILGSHSKDNVPQKYRYRTRCGKSSGRPVKIELRNSRKGY